MMVLLFLCRYSIAGDADCNECSAGSYCPFTYADTETACPSGFFSAAGQDVCHPCRGGYECNGGRTAEVECAAGTYSPPMEDDCLTCDADRICPYAGMAYPKECDSVGDYRMNTTHCEPCPAGSFCPTPDEVVLCAEHYYSDAGSLACTLCEPGYLCTGTGNTDAQGSVVGGGSGDLCPIGYWCNPADSQDPCPAGMYGVKEGGSSMEDACDPCPAGYMCEEGAHFDVGSGDVNIDECTVGHYCPEGTQTATAVPCRSGTYISLPMDAVDGGDGVHFNDDESDCTPCPATFYCAEAVDGSGRGADTCVVAMYLLRWNIVGRLLAGLHGWHSRSELLHYVFAAVPSDGVCACTTGTTRARPGTTAPLAHNTRSSTRARLASSTTRLAKMTNTTARTAHPGTTARKPRRT